MKRTVYLAALAALAASCDAIAIGGIAEVSIVDRNSGVELVPHFYRGEYWVAGIPGATYSIAIRNHLGERLLAVTSVDGVNVISGATAAWDKTGYVFDPNERYEITGWRKSDSEVAAFTFTASPNSYAERTGRPANVGVIGVAFFRERERQPQAVYAPPEPEQSLDRQEAPPLGAPAPEPTWPSASSPPHAAASASASAAPNAPAPAPSTSSRPKAPAPPQSSGSSPSSAQATTRDARASGRQEAFAAPRPAAPKLGTGHGEREFSYVNHTEFSRMQPEPNEVIRIRYDSLDNLVAMGIIQRPRPAPTANPFPASPAQQYAPDPPERNGGAR
jgi:hypothetical protein